MYKYKVQYRVYLSTSKPGDNHPHLSGRKDLEFKLNERLVKDGPGRWKNTLINIIKQNDPSVTYVYDDMILKDLGFENDNKSNDYREISQEEKDSIYASKVEENRISREARWAEKDRQRESDERQRLIDIQEQRLRDERDAKERAERRARANELRSQGKNFQAFLVEFQNGVIAGSVIIGFALFFFFFNLYKDGNKADAMKINSELEQIEDSVKIYINNKNYDKALFLANKLVHSSHEDMEHLDFDAWSGYPKFDEYWTKKREEYKKIILNKGVLNSDEKTLENSKEENTESIDSEETPIDEGNYNEIESDTIINQEGLDPEYQEN